MKREHYMKTRRITYGWDGCLLRFDKMASRSINTKELVDQEMTAKYKEFSTVK